MKNLNKLLLLVTFMFVVNKLVMATGEPSTYFNIFVPPNNDPVQRNVCLVVTAIFDSTTFDIVDDGMDGDTDDSKSGMLMAGESYILYIKDNGINDDARYASGGVLKQDGDYFVIHSNKNVFASQSTNSDWQHDWVPGVSQSSLSQKFIIYTPKVTSSRRDFNIFPYEDSTYVTLRKISTSPTLQTGYTNVDYQGGTIIFQRMINRGEDLIHFYTDARNVLIDGETYIIETSKPATMQYGALFGNEKDGGGYVPTNTGSSSGSLAYFCVPYSVAGEQEIRVVSWDSANVVKLYRYSAGNWILMTNWNMGKRTAQEWVGKNNGNVGYATVFKIECTPGKRVSIFEGNWFETGSPGTSDMATMMSAENGTSSGNYFLAYMAPPGNQTNVLDPFTNKVFGGRFTHLYIFSQDTAIVNVKDAYTNGVDFSRTYTILPGRYIDCALSEAEWKNIYNGTGTIAGGPERPYLTVTSNNNISVMNTNFNDNWMMYFGSSQFQGFNQKTTSSSSTVMPGDSLFISSKPNILGSTPVTNVTAEVLVEGGLTVLDAKFVDSTNNVSYKGNTTVNQSNVLVNFDSLPNLQTSSNYGINLILKGNVMDASGNPIPNNSVSDVTITISGTSNGKPQQSTSIESVALNSYNSNKLIYDFAENTGLENVLTNSYTVSTIDFNNDGNDDLFFTDASSNQPNKLFQNNGNGTFTEVKTGNIVNDLAKSISSSWADVDNDGDLDVAISNNTQKSCFFYVNNGNGTFTKNTSAEFTKKAGYYHHVSWVDVDNDGQVELYLGNYWPTRTNELWRKSSTGNWVLWEENLLSQITGTGTGATWADFDNDGFQDLLILNNEDGKNRMFHNRGNGQFESISNSVTNKGGNSVGSTWGDIDHDSDLDLFISNASNLDNELYLNLGNNNFSLVSNSIVSSDKGHSHGALFLDADNDKDLDLMVANDQGVKFLYINDGSGNFTAKTDEWPCSNFGKSYGVSAFDMENDGDLDLVFATHSNNKNQIFTANNTNKKWLTVKCIGTSSNKSAIGTKIKVKAGGIWQMREINSQTGFGGQSSFKNHFGLGSTSIIDSLIIMWPSGFNQILTSVNCNQNMVITEQNYSTINAKVFFDENNNCTKDSNEKFLRNIKYKFNNKICYSNDKGEIKLNLETGNYNILLADTSYQVTCPNPSVLAINRVGADTNLGNFAIKNTCVGTDLQINASTTVMRRGFNSSYIIEVNNNGVSQATNLSIKAFIPLSISIDSTDLPWISNQVTDSTRTITWNLANLPHNEGKIIHLYYRVSLSNTIGNSINSKFTVSSTQTDCKMLNNEFNDLQEVVGSMDPNDILAFPVGMHNEHFIHQNQIITYKIRFQNVGNYYAQFVNLETDIDPSLDINSIHGFNASHNYNLSIENRKLLFHFPDIILPDSSTDNEGSNGYVQFSIAQNKDVKNGTLIKKFAKIQFDYNEFITTNEVFHTVLINDLEKNDHSLVAFPNPGNEKVYFRIVSSNDEENNEITNISFTNNDGSYSKSFSCQTLMPLINTDVFPNGFYTIQAKNKLGKIYRGKLIINHN